MTYSGILETPVFVCSGVQKPEFSVGSALKQTGCHSAPRVSGRLHHALMAQPRAGRCRTNFDTFDCDEGEKLMRIYTAGATRANMLEHLQRYAGAPRVITFDKSRVYSSENNVYIEDPGRDSVVRELKKRFAPVSLRGWKNIFHL